MILNKEDSLAFAKWLTEWPAGAYRVWPDIITGNGGSKMFHCTAFWDGEHYPKSAWSKDHWLCMREEALAQEPEQNLEQSFSPTHLLVPFCGDDKEPVEVLFESDHLFVIKREDGSEDSFLKEFAALLPYNPEQLRIKDKLLEKWNEYYDDDVEHSFDSRVRLEELLRWLSENDLVNTDVLDA